MDWIKEIDEITNKFILEFKDLSEDELNWKPNSQTWSIAQNIHHLIVLNSTYFPTFEELKKGRNDLPLISRFGLITGFFGNFILKSVSPDNRSKTKTFPIWEPEKSNLDNNILSEFQNHQLQLKTIYLKLQI